MIPVDEPLYGPAARAMRDALRKSTAHTGDSDPDMDEALRRARQRPMTQTRHALTALARTTPGRRRLIAACAEDYLAQVDRRRLPVGYCRPILDDRINRGDAFELRRGDQFARMLGIACRPDDKHLPATARAVLDTVTAPVRQLTAVAATTGQPHLIAALHIAGGRMGQTPPPSEKQLFAAATPAGAAR